MFDRCYRIADKPTRRSVPRGIRANRSRAVTLALLLSSAGCQGPGPAVSPASGVEAEDPRRSTAEIVPAEELEAEVILRSAADILPATQLSGPYHNVRDEVVVRGFVHYYVIESPYGEFLAAGDEEARERTHEINAIANLRRLSKSEVIADSATDAAKRSYVAAKEVIDKPWETAKAIPSGLGRLFKRSKRQAEDAYDDVTEWYRGDDDGGSNVSKDAQTDNQGLTKKKIRRVVDLGIDESQGYVKGSLGFDREFRQLARRLGVDPYTRNAVLRHEMTSMAWTATTGSFVANLILPEVPVPVGLLKDTQDLVWDTKAIDLLLSNEAAVRSMNIDSDKLEEFFGNKNLTLSDQTRFVKAMERLRGVSNTAPLLHKAAQAQSREETRFYVRSAEMLALYHAQQASIKKLIEVEQGPMVARDSGGRLIVALPLDYLNWSQSAHDIAMAIHSTPEQHARSDVFEVWIEGTVSKRAMRELSRFGWKVNEHAFEDLATRSRSAG